MLFQKVLLYDTIQVSTIATSLKKKRGKSTILQKDCQVVELFIEKYPEKYETQKCTLTTFSLAISIPEENLDHPNKHVPL